MCVDSLDVGWGLPTCRIIVSFTRVNRDGVCFGLVRSALLLAVVLCWVDRCFDSWMLLALLCLLRVTHIHRCSGVCNQPLQFYTIVYNQPLQASDAVKQQHAINNRVAAARLGLA